MMFTEREWTRASQTTDIEEFLWLAFPRSWDGIRARILESGAVLSPDVCEWAPRWSAIPAAVRTGNNPKETAVKTVIYRVHDAIHQLWGLPHPRDFSEGEKYYYKRAQMCGEVAVLSITEFVYCSHLIKLYPELHGLLYARNAVPLLADGLFGRTLPQIAARLDGLLHKKIRSRWVRQSPHATAFVDDYVPKLEFDREQIDQNWAAMETANWKPGNLPQARFGRHLDGLELTLWMIQDWEQLMTSSNVVDEGLVEFNRKRRAALVLPEGWAS